MLENLSFELLEDRFDDLYNMRSGVDVKEDHLTLLIGSFYSDCLIYTVQLGNVELLVDRGISFRHFPVHHALPVSPNIDNFLFGWRSCLILGFGVFFGATHSFLCFILTHRHHFSSLMMIRYKRAVHDFVLLDGG